MRQEKELLITLEFPPDIGGISTYLSELFRGFPVGNLKILTAPGKEIAYPHAIIRKNFYFKNFWPRWFKALLITLKICKSENIKRIYISHILPMGYIAYAAKMLLGIPYVIFFHGLDVRLAKASAWKRSWFKSIVREAEAIIANSVYTKDEILKNLKPFKRAIEVIQPPPKTMKSITEVRDKPIILSVARLVPRKGIDLAIAAFPKIISKIPDARYYIIGDGPERARLQAQIASLKLQESVILLGLVPDATLAEFYGRASVFLFPVREIGADVEGFGIAPLEASAHGVPVVASKSGGVEEVVGDGVTGILVPPGDVLALAEASIFILKNPALSKAMSEAGIKWGAKFNPEAQTQKLRSILWK